MFDFDLAVLYNVETRILNQAVKRNSRRFPADFMFQLTDIEFHDWKSQIVISNAVNMGLRKKPFVFTELGVAMLSSVLNSKYNDINEDTRLQIELINQSLAELHIDKKQNSKPKNKIGYFANKNDEQ